MCLRTQHGWAFVVVVAFAVLLCCVICLFVFVNLCMCVFLWVRVSAFCEFVFALFREFVLALFCGFVFAFFCEFGKTTPRGVNTKTMKNIGNTPQNGTRKNVVNLGGSQLLLHFDAKSKMLLKPRTGATF